MTPTPATGLWGPGDYPAGFVTIDALTKSIKRAVAVDGSKWWSDLNDQRYTRTRIRNAILDLAHDLDARGLVMVPREPTMEMARALESNYAECLPASEVHLANWREAYAAMLDVAPLSAPRPPEPAYTANADLATGGE